MKLYNITKTTIGLQLCENNTNMKTIMNGHRDFSTKQAFIILKIITNKSIRNS